MRVSQASRKMAEFVAGHWDQRLGYQTLEVETTKSSFREILAGKIPLLYEGGFFSPYVKVLARILLDERQFLSSYHLEELKSVVKPQKLVLKSVQAFCMLVSLKPTRKSLPNGSLEIDYFTPF